MSDSDPGTVAVIDDNLLFSSGLVAGLKRLGYTPLLLSDARDAVARSAAARPRVVLVNLSPLAWDPGALIRALKAEPTLAGVPVVGFAGHMEVARIEAGRAAGCDHVVANSAISGDLAGILRHVLPSAS
jgi:CheY-like chemotaxis protein